MQKMDGKSLDLVEVNRRAVMEALKGVAPEVVSESGVDLEKLAILIGEDKNLSDKLERYNFTWPDKRKAIKSALTPSSGTLRPAPKESVNWDNTKNLYIEGDNLEVLKLLQKSYFGKIKMIYIDPPYNTGKEFVYPDDYADNIQNYLELTGQINESGRRITTNTETSGRYHTNWLNMMYPRLKLARNLLRDDGVIFISIDDHEVSNLRKICDEIFGEENFVGNIICKTATDNNKTQIACEHEYITCYVKSIETQYSWEARSINGKKIIDKYKVLKSTYGYDLTTIQSKLRIWIKENETDLQGVSHYSYVDDKGVFYPGNSANTKKGDYYYDVIHPKTKKICAKPENGYRWPLKTLLAADKNNDVLWGDDETTIPKIKKRLESVVDKLKSYYYEDSRKNTSEFKELFDNKSIFENPKSYKLLIYLSKFILKSDDIILDFFSGSATTAHAVLELNKEDGGNRQFIMVQLPEPCGEDSEAFKAGYKNICEIGKERIRRVIKKIEAEYAESEKSTQGELDLGAPAKQKPDLGFKVFKLDTSNFIPWDSNPDNLSEESLQRSLSNIKLDRSQQDLLYELFLKLGVTLNTPYQKVELAGKYMYDIGYGSIYACLDDDLDMDFCKAMIAYHDAQFPKEESKDKKEERELEKYRLETTTFIFRDSSFADDNIKTNILQTLRQMGLTNIRAI